MALKKLNSLLSWTENFGIRWNTFEALGKESFDDEPAAVVLQSGGSKHLPGANLLLLVELGRVFVTWGLR